VTRLGSSLQHPPPLTLEQIEEAIGPLDGWAENCHRASRALVRSGVLDDRGKYWTVARGWSTEIRSQHSWIVNDDPYAFEAWVLDVTAWSWVPDRPRVWWVQNLLWHVPHGFGRLSGMPVPTPTGEPVQLRGLSPRVKAWLTHRYPTGYGQADLARLASGPVFGWPCRDILRAMDQAGFRALIPVDTWAMVVEGGWH
jgi:hypothetical protein